MNLSLILVAMLLSIVTVAKGEVCAGCPVKVDKLSEKQQSIVDFAVLQLQGGADGVCKKKVLTTKNFSQQVSHIL